MYHRPGFIDGRLTDSLYWVLGWQSKKTARKSTGEDCCFFPADHTPGHAKFENNQISGTKCSLNTGRVGDGVDL